MSKLIEWPDDVARDLLCAGHAHVPILLTGGTPAARLAAASEVHELSGALGPFVSAQATDLPPVTDRCTVYLEDVGLLGPIEQQGILRWLDDQVAHVPPCTRLISAAGNDIFEAVSKGHFDARLFYRLNAIHIRLREGPFVSGI